MKTAIFRGLASGCLALLGLVSCVSESPRPASTHGPGDTVSPPNASAGDGGAGGATATGGGATATGGGSSAAAGGAGPGHEVVDTVLLIPGTTITADYFDTMAARLHADGFTPIVYESPDLMTGSLVDEAQQIAARVQQVLAEQGASRLHIVAECDGGVATRYYLERLGGSAYVDQAVTFVSAHHGTWLSPVGEWVTGWQALADIRPDSPFMSDLSSAPFPAGLKLTSIYTCNDEYMVPYDTSVVDGATNVLFCSYFLTHFDGFWDAVVYDRIHAALIGQGDDAPTYY